MGAAEQRAVVYICGDAARMAPDVRRAYMSIHQAKTGGDAAASEAWLNGLIASSRYLEDIWAST